MCTEKQCCGHVSVRAHTGDVSAACRATYAAEQSVQRLEKGKKDQDLLIDHLHQQVRTQEQQIAIYSQQYENQQRETRAAREMLAEAQAEMEGVHFEKKQLTAQWQSSLIATQRRDQALRVSFCARQSGCCPECIRDYMLEPECSCLPNGRAASFPHSRGTKHSG